jgi:hypothetical protein
MRSLAKVMLITNEIAVASQVSANTSWIQAFARGNRLAYKVWAQVVGTSVAAKLSQATDSAGTGAKDITGAAITTITAAGSGKKFALIEIGPGAMDDKNNFAWVRLVATIVGTCTWGVERMEYELRSPGEIAQDASFVESIAVYD